MKVKKFTANTMTEAMSMVRQELGADAVILQARTLSKGFLGFFQRQKVEITAAADVAISGDAGPITQPRPEKQYPEPVSIDSQPPSTGARRSAPESFPEVSRLARLEDKISKLTATVEALVEKNLGSGCLTGKWANVFQNLMLTGMEEALAHELIEDLSRAYPDPEQVLNDNRILVKHIQRSISVQGGIQLPAEGQKVVVLIGPTGVGKTTTLAKIAANFLKEGHRIAFITADTYRLAAVEQLGKYADIMNLSLETVYGPEEMEKAVARHADKELVLVDTAGRSQLNTGQMEDLQSLVVACQPAEVHLLLAATTKREDLEEELERFSVCPLDRLILTKVDESTCFGPFYSVSKRSPIPFSFVTTGQNVPEDIEEATGELIAQLICRGAADAPIEDNLGENAEQTTTEVSVES